MFWILKFTFREDEYSSWTDNYQKLRTIKFLRLFIFRGILRVWKIRRNWNRKIFLNCSANAMIISTGYFFSNVVSTCKLLSSRSNNQILTCVFSYCVHTFYINLLCNIINKLSFCESSFESVLKRRPLRSYSHLCPLKFYFLLLTH